MGVTNYKQNLSHIGKELRMMCVHGHCKTMEGQWAEVLNAFWTRLAAYIRKCGVHFVAGDFNMSLFQVVSELRSRGVSATCAAWYPWQMSLVPGEFARRMPSLGLDSCGIFYIGKSALISPQYGLANIDALTSVTADNDPVTQYSLHQYERNNAPGQHWSCYTSSLPGWGQQPGTGAA